VEARLDQTQGWVVDGNYDAKLGDTLTARAGLIVWLDLNGNRESLRTALWGGESLFVWAVRSHFMQKREWPHEPWYQRAVRLRSAAEVAEWFTSPWL
jgi:hypothetical protein